LHSFTNSLISHPSLLSINTCFSTPLRHLLLISDDEEASKVINSILIIVYKLIQVYNSLNNLFYPERGLKADKARLKYFKTHAQHDLQINLYLIEEYLYLLIKRKLVKYKANLLEIAT